MNGKKEVSGSRPGEDGEGNKDDSFDKDVSCNMRSLKMNNLIMYNYST